MRNGRRNFSGQSRRRIRTYHDAILMLDAGADSIGASSGVTIVSEGC